MVKDLMNQLKTACLLLSILMLITGFIYPLVITGLAQFFFPFEANGSLIIQNNRILGSRLIGQEVSSAEYFWPRPSATTPFPYNSEASQGSNFGPSNPLYLDSIKTRISQLQKANPNNKNPIPVDLITASGSGLDPEISPSAAKFQAQRIALAHHLPESQILQLIQEQTIPPFLGFLGEPRINVLELNLALKRLGEHHD